MDKKVLTDATVAYQFDGVTTGTLLSNNTTLGMCTAIDAIVPLLQQNGWYMQFDSSNVCHIGLLSVSTVSSRTTILTDSNIIDISTLTNDKMFRNRVVVWGNANRDGSWVFYDLDRSGSYPGVEYDATDTRSIVIANSNIDTINDASILASRALKEFDQTTKEYVITVAGAVNVSLGGSVSVRSKYCQVVGIATNVGSSLSEAGLITHIIIGQRCPRLYAFYDWDGDNNYVYVGTDGAGVWKKPFQSTHTWTDFSAGLPLADRSITDLAIQDDIFACVTTQGNLYTNYYGAGWVKFDPGGFTGVSSSGTTVDLPAASGACIACTIDKATNEVIGAYSTSGEDSNFSWIYFVNGSTASGIQLTTDDGAVSYTVLDIDNNGVNNIVTVAISGQDSKNFLWNNTGAHYLDNNEHINTTAFIDNGAVLNNVGDATIVSGNNPRSRSVCGDGKYIFVSEVYDTGSDYALTIRMLDTKNNVNQATERVLSYNNIGYCRAEWVRAIGEKRVAVVIVNQITGFYDIKIVDFITLEDTDIQTNITDAEEMMGANVSVRDDRVRYYMLSGGSDSTLIRLRYFDINSSRVVTVGSTSAPATYNGGTFYYLISETYELSISESGHIYCVMEVAYEDMPVNPPWGSYTHIAIFPLVFHCQIFDYSHSILSVSTSVGDYLGSLGEGALALDYGSSTTLTTGAKDNDFYLTLYAEYYVSEYDVDWTYLLYKYSNTTGSVVFNSIQELGYLAGNSSSMYVIDEDKHIKNADTGSLIKSFSPDFSAVSPIADDEFPGILLYDRTSGDVIKIPLTASGVGASGIAASGVITYPLDLHPDLSDSYTGGLDTITLVFDSVYVGVDTYKSGSRKHRMGLITPSGDLSGTSLSGVYGSGYTTSLSGSRLFEDDYSMFFEDTNYVLQGYKGSYVTVVDETSLPFMVDISNPNVVGLRGNESYSGITINGSGTGYDFGQILLSPTGDENTYTSLVLSSLSGAVSDMRSFSALASVGNATELRTFLVFPQVNGVVTELTLTDISALTTTPGTIIASGSLSTSYILETFNGVVDHVETTNNQDVPYIFASEGSVPPVFWQRNSRRVEEPLTEFIDRTTNLPASRITIIRADDLV